MAVELLQGTNITLANLDGGTLKFGLSDMWQVAENVASRFGADWFLNFPMLWSLETQSEFGLAMRYARDFGSAIDLVKELWNVRWPIGQVHIERTEEGYRIAIIRTVRCSDQNWMMATSIVALNFAAVAKAVVSQEARLIRYEFGGQPPTFAGRLSDMLDANTSWNHNYSSIFVTRSLLGCVSPLVNPESFSSMIEILRKRTRLQTDFESTKSQVSLLLHGINQGQIDAEKAAQLLGMAKRTLERRLTQEGTSFRELSMESFKRRLESLLLVPGSTAESMAEQLGYHDGSSLMRACRRIYGRSLSEIRQDVAPEQLDG